MPGDSPWHTHPCVVVSAGDISGAVVSEHFAGEILPRSIGIVETAETHILSVMQLPWS
jgi:hypothetical protein